MARRINLEPLHTTYNTGLSIRTFNARLLVSYPLISIFPGQQAPRTRGFGRRNEPGYPPGRLAVLLFGPPP